MTLWLRRLRKRTGFTLIEVLVTVSILSLGMVLIFQSNMMSLHAYSLYSSRLKVQSWAEEKLWEAQESILEGEGSSFPGSTSGEELIGGKPCRWSLSIVSDSFDKVEFYTVDLKVSWKEGSRKEELLRRATLRKFKE